MNEKSTKKPSEMVFNSMWSLCNVPDFPTVGKSCCEVLRTPSLREIINTYAETGQIIVHTNSFIDDIPGDDSKLGDYDIVDAWCDANELENARADALAFKKSSKKPNQVTNQEPNQVINQESD